MFVMGDPTGIYSSPSAARFREAPEGPDVPPTGTRDTPSCSVRPPNLSRPVATAGDMQAYAIRRAALHEDDDGRYTLSETGRLQAELLAAHLAGQPEPVEAVYTGTSDRHRETVTVLSSVFDLVSGRDVPVRELPELDDVPWPKETLQHCIEEGLGQREWVQAWVEGDLDLGETPAEVRDRVLEAKGAIRDDRPGDATVLAVTSAVPLLALAMDALGGSVTETALPVNNTALFDLRWGTSDTAVQLNATPHLTGDLLTRDGFKTLSWPPGPAGE